MSVTKIFGIHAVQAALAYSAKKIRYGWVDAHRQDKRLKRLLEEMAVCDITVEMSERKRLDRLTEGKNHQGIVVEIEMPSILSEEQLKQAVSQLTTVPLLLVLDQVQDPHNLGACLRTADASGAQGIIVPKDNAVGITPTVCKVASGAAETVPVYQVTNLARTLRWLKSQNIWIMGSNGAAQQSLYEEDLTVPLAIVMGTEGSGMRALTEKQCDFLVHIPMLGQVESLNVSVATGILLYEAFRQRMASRVDIFNK